MSFERAKKLIFLGQLAIGKTSYKTHPADTEWLSSGAVFQANWQLSSVES